MDYYFISRKKNGKTQFLRITPRGKHVWLADRSTATEFNTESVQKKCKTLRSMGRANYSYSPQWAYFQKEIFSR